MARKKKIQPVDDCDFLTEDVEVKRNIESEVALKKNPLFIIRKFKSEIDLHNIGAKAQNKKHWRKIIAQVVEATYSDPARFVPDTVTIRRAN